MRGLGVTVVAMLGCVGAEQAQVPPYVDFTDASTFDDAHVSPEPCPSPRAMCGTACVDLDEDAQHCGACGRRCLVGMQCQSRQCVPGCMAGQRYIPPGSFVQGSDTLGDETARPAHRVVVERGFCMDTYEVGRFGYMTCYANERPRCEPPGANSTYWGVGDFYYDLPVNHVDRARAEYYCRVHHGRLPTEAEWEYAARGSDGRPYPWGSEPPGYDRVCWIAVDTGRPCEFGARPLDRSPFGIMDLGGNLSEWVADDEVPGAYAARASVVPRAHEVRVGAPGSRHILRGGNYNERITDGANSARRWLVEPGLMAGTVGFRCVSDPLPITSEDTARALGDSVSTRPWPQR